MDAKKYYSLESKNDVADLYIFGDITSWPWLESDVSASGIVNELQSLDVKEINVHINSYGGEVAEGLAIYNTLKNSDMKVTTICDGFACSAASVIFMAVVKSVKVTENSETSDVYASGKIYDSDSPMSSIDIEVSVIAFPDDTISKMRGETKGTGGLILAGGKSERPIFAYGKVVKLKNGKSRYEWFPKCKLVENSDDIATSEEKASEQTDTIKIRAYPFDAEGNIVSKVTESTAPAGLTEEKFFAKPILTDADLTTAVGA